MIIRFERIWHNGLFPYAIGMGVVGSVVGMLSVMAQPNPTNSETNVNTIVIEQSSGPSEIALAKHLAQAEATVYTAYWCPHCHKQLSLFGSKAAQKLTRVECDPRGTGAQPQLCQAAQIESYPTWIIKGKRYLGTQSLSALANATDYRGPRRFKNLIP